jgi:hypothetical protein
VGQILYLDFPALCVLNVINSIVALARAWCQLKATTISEELEPQRKVG